MSAVLAEARPQIQLAQEPQPDQQAATDANATGETVTVSAITSSSPSSGDLPCVGCTAGSCAGCPVANQMLLKFEPIESIADPLDTIDKPKKPMLMMKRVDQPSTPEKSKPFISLTRVVEAKADLITEAVIENLPIEPTVQQSLISPVLKIPTPISPIEVVQELALVLPEPVQHRSDSAAFENAKPEKMDPPRALPVNLPTPINIGEYISKRSHSEPAHIPFEQPIQQPLRENSIKANGEVKQNEKKTDGQATHALLAIKPFNKPDVSTKPTVPIQIEHIGPVALKASPDHIQPFIPSDSQQAKAETKPNDLSAAHSDLSAIQTGEIPPPVSPPDKTKIIRFPVERTTAPQKRPTVIEKVSPIKPKETPGKVIPFKKEEPMVENIASNSPAAMQKVTEDILTPSEAIQTIQIAEAADPVQVLADETTTETTVEIPNESVDTSSPQPDSDTNDEPITYETYDVSMSLPQPEKTVSPEASTEEVFNPAVVAMMKRIIIEDAFVENDFDTTKPSVLKVNDRILIAKVDEDVTGNDDSDKDVIQESSDLATIRELTTALSVVVQPKDESSDETKNEENAVIIRVSDRLAEQIAEIRTVLVRDQNESSTYKKPEENNDAPVILVAKNNLIIMPKEEASTLLMHYEEAAIELRTGLQNGTKLVEEHEALVFEENSSFEKHDTQEPKLPEQIVVAKREEMTLIGAASKELHDTPSDPLPIQDIGAVVHVIETIATSEIPEITSKGLIDEEQKTATILVAESVFDIIDHAYSEIAQDFSDSPFQFATISFASTHNTLHVDINTLDRLLEKIRDEQKAIDELSLGIDSDFRIPHWYILSFFHFLLLIP